MILWTLFLIALISASAAVILVLARVLFLRRGREVSLEGPTVYALAQKQVDHAAFHLVVVFLSGIKYLYAQAAILLHRAVVALKQGAVKLERRIAGLTHSARTSEAAKGGSTASFFLREIEEHQKRVRAFKPK